MIVYDPFNLTAKFNNVDGLEWKVLQTLIDSTDPDIEDFWKLLKYDTEDALLQNKLTKKEKQGMIELSLNNLSDQASLKQIIMAPYLDEALTFSGSKMFIYVSGIHPSRSDKQYQVELTVDLICHAKIALIAAKTLGDEDLEYQNPNETDIDGNPIVKYKNRITALTTRLISALNGLINLDLGGHLALNNARDISSKSDGKLFSSRSYYGSETVFTVTFAQTRDD